MQVDPSGNRRVFCGQIHLDINIKYMNFAPRILYSIGIRCYTEIILKRLNLRKMSSIFGSMNMKNSDNLIESIKNPDVLFNESNLVFTRNIKSMEEENKIHGFRTLHRKFDDINGYHTSTFAHHDLSQESVKNHFKRGIVRLHKIKKHNIPILFIQISHESEYNNSKQNDNLFKSFKESGFTNYSLIQIYLHESSSNNLFSKEANVVNENYIIYNLKIDCKYGEEKYDKDVETILKKHFNLSNLISKDEIDNLT